jgi:hypothetical protein
MVFNALHLFCYVQLSNRSVAVAGGCDGTNISCKVLRGVHMDKLLFSFIRLIRLAFKDVI